MQQWKIVPKSPKIQNQEHQTTIKPVNNDQKTQITRQIPKHPAYNRASIKKPEQFDDIKSTPKEQIKILDIEKIYEEVKNHSKEIKSNKEQLDDLRKSLLIELKNELNSQIQNLNQELLRTNSKQQENIQQQIQSQKEEFQFQNEILIKEQKQNQSKIVKLEESLNKINIKVSLLEKTKQNLPGIDLLINQKKKKLTPLQTQFLKDSLNNSRIQYPSARTSLHGDQSIRTLPNQITKQKTKQQFMIKKGNLSESIEERFKKCYESVSIFKSQVDQLNYIFDKNNQIFKAQFDTTIKDKFNTAFKLFDEQLQNLIIETKKFLNNYEQLKCNQENIKNEINRIKQNQMEQLKLVQIFDQSFQGALKNNDEIKEKIQKNDIDCEQLSNQRRNQFNIKNGDVMNQNIKGQPYFNLKEHPDKKRLKKVQELINQIYNQSWRKRNVQAEFLKFVRDEQQIQQLYQYYGIRQYQIKRKLAEICNAFREARGDGNQFYTTFGFLFFEVLLYKYQNTDYYNFIEQMDKFITFNINYGQGNSIQDKELQNECWNEFKFRLEYLKNQDKDQFIKHYQAFEQNSDQELIDGCFYGLSTIIFRNLVKYLIDKNEETDNNRILNWEEECNHDSVQNIIKALSNFLKLYQLLQISNIKLLYFNGGSFQLEEFQERQQYEIIVLIQSNQYNIGYFDESKSQMQD